MAERAYAGRTRVVVTGLGVVSALGCSSHEFWSGLLAGRSGIVALTDPELANCSTRMAALVSGYDPTTHFSSRELKRLGRASQFAIVAAAEALESAGLDGDGISLQGAAVILGGTSAGFATIESTLRTYFTERSLNDPLIIPTVMGSAPASNVSLRFGCRGPVLSIDAACASSAHAIGYASVLIRSGALQLALAGGVDASICASVLHAWSGLHVLSRRNATPFSACRPFSIDRDGPVLGEGAGILVLESERSAFRRGAPILAEVSGYGATSDGHHLTQPSLDGITQAMRTALSDAELDPADVDYVNAHATATTFNDKIETAAIKNVLGERASEIPVVGIKGSIGHAVAASGALEFVSCVLSIRNKVVPPTINLTSPDPECDLDYVAEGPRQHAVRNALSNSFAFGGSNAVLVASRYAQ